jgi:tRNA modification GTPase
MEKAIAAISTSTVSSGGISVVRMSGENVIEIADRIFVSPSGKKLADADSHTVHYGHIIKRNNSNKEYDKTYATNNSDSIKLNVNDNNYEVIDEVLVIVMRAPNTYTREDIVEIDCHGGLLVTRKVLSACLSAGAFPAEPGEFTKRAFLNGRIDLSQAEAVIDVINSKNDYALQSSVNQLDGALSKKIRNLREIILNHVAYIEAALDDPEHIELDNYVENVKIDVDNCVNIVDNLVKNAENGRIVRDGIKTVILGKTNAGKSSLLNALAREDRAIVTDIEGTTRDVLEEQINIGGITLNLIDTAGIRKTTDIVENIGVEKAKKYASEADLIIYVVDGSRELDSNDYDIINLIRDKKVIVLLNKSDMEQIVSTEDLKELSHCDIIPVSAKEETGLDRLEESVKNLVFSGKVSFNDEVIITNERHKSLLQEALGSLRLVSNAIDDGVSEDFLTIDLMNAYEKLGLIIGEAVEDDLANQIFSKFCMGK